MDSDALFDLIATSAGPLRAVDLHTRVAAISGDDILSCEDLVALRLTFADGALWISCVAATDEVLVSASTPPWSSAAVTPLSAGPFWASYLSLRLLSVSILTSERGYEHAVQLEFGDEQGSHHSPVQIEAAASSFLFWRLSGPHAVP